MGFLSHMLMPWLKQLFFIMFYIFYRLFVLTVAPYGLPLGGLQQSKA